MSTNKHPSGVMLMVVWPDGALLAEVSDFHENRLSSFSLQESQKIRCQDRIARKVVDNLCNPIVGKALSSYHQQELLSSLISRHGFVKHEIVIGHEGGAA